MSSYFSSSSVHTGALPLSWAAVGAPAHLQHINHHTPGQIWVARASDAQALTIARERADVPGVAALIHELDAFQSALYPAASVQSLDADALMAPHARMLVVRNAQQQVLACGAVLLLEDYAELQQMMVLPGQRGRGVGARLLRALEREAVRAGRPLLRLATGVRQHDAQRLFERMGFERCGPFGACRADPFSIFMEKLLG